MFNFSGGFTDLPLCFPVPDGPCFHVLLGAGKRKGRNFFLNRVFKCFPRNIRLRRPIAFYYKNRPRTRRGDGLCCLLGAFKIRILYF